jgi:hypothetical protein
MSGTPLSLGQVILPIIMFVGSGFAVAKAYDDHKAKSKMAYFWMLMFLIFVGGGYYTLTKGVTATNVRGMAQASIANGQQKFANWRASRAVGIQGPPGGAPYVPPAGAAAPMVPV